MAVAGCAGNASEEPSSPGGAGKPISAPADPVPDGPVPQEQIDGSALPQGYPREAATRGNGRTVVITAQEAGCGKASAKLVEQTRTGVVVLLVHTVPSGDVMCTMDIRYPQVTIDLDEPLADRRLVLEPEERTK
ncbi:MAG: hypothetical protein ACRDQ7_24905 [Haloechinothrix sp.]